MEVSVKTVDVKNYPNYNWTTRTITAQPIADIYFSTTEGAELHFIGRFGTWVIRRRIPIISRLYVAFVTRKER